MRATSRTSKRLDARNAALDDFAMAMMRG